MTNISAGAGGNDKQLLAGDQQRHEVNCGPIPRRSGPALATSCRALSLPTSPAQVCLLAFRAMQVIDRPPGHTSVPGWLTDSCLLSS